MHFGPLRGPLPQPLPPGFAALRKTGSRRNGGERDKGSRFHAVPFNSNKALCGTEPGDRSDWSEYPGNDATCPRCLAKLAKAAA